MPIADQGDEIGKASASQETAIFKLFSLGVVTNRDEWVYDFDPKASRMQRCVFYLRTYNENDRRWQEWSTKNDGNSLIYRIKWTANVKNDLAVIAELCVFRAIDRSLRSIGLLQDVDFYFDRPS